MIPADSHYKSQIVGSTNRIGAAYMRSHRLYCMQRPALLVRGAASPSTTEPRLLSLTEPHLKMISPARRTSLTVESSSLLIEFSIPNKYLSHRHTAMKNLNSRYPWTPGPCHPPSEHFMINGPRHPLLACSAVSSEATGAPTRFNRGAPMTRTRGSPTTPHVTSATHIRGGAFPPAHVSLTTTRSQNEEP